MCLRLNLPTQGKYYSPNATRKTCEGCSPSLTAQGSASSSAHPELKCRAGDQMIQNTNPRPKHRQAFPLPGGTGPSSTHSLSEKAGYHTSYTQCFVQSIVQGPEVWSPVGVAKAPLERKESGEDLWQLVQG